MFDQARPESQFLKPAPPKRISLPSSQRLNTILESSNPGGAVPTEQPQELCPRIQNARRSYLAHHGFPPLHGDEKPPPSYSQLSSSRGSGVDLSSARYSQSSRIDGPAAVDGGPYSRARHSLTRRGGWKKLVLVAAAVLLILIGLAVGLGVGLTQRNKGKPDSDSSAENDAGSTGQSASTAFPAGLWSFDVVLAATNSSCTANADTWSCFPYTTFDESPTASQYSFNWNISRESGGGSQLMISSSGNVFSLTFPTTPLVLVGEGTADERLTFSLSQPKQTQSTGLQLGGNGQSICYFNQSVLAATLYTRGSKMAGSSTTLQRWPGTSYIEQSSPGGSGVPDCYSKQGTGIGARITQGPAPQPPNSRCSCVYESNNGTGAAL